MTGVQTCALPISTDTRRARVILIEAGERLLPAFDPKLSRKALQQLEGLGVDVRLGLPVTAIHDDGVEVGGERLRSYNVIWAAGVRAAPLVQTLGAETGPGGRVKVQGDCSLPGHHPGRHLNAITQLLIRHRPLHSIPSAFRAAT